jgi:hypothetical protein
VTATAGCTAVLNFIGDQFLEDVNVFNETNRRLQGTVTVTSADGDAVLDEAFALQSVAEETETDSSQGNNVAFYADVWTGAGTYDVGVSLSSGTIAGSSEATSSVTIDDPDEEMLAILLGAGEADTPIAFRTGTEFSEFTDQ